MIIVLKKLRLSIKIKLKIEFMNNIIKISIRRYLLQKIMNNNKD